MLLLEGDTSIQQLAIVGLDGRLDTLETAGGVEQSLDDAYDDGSVVTVDDTDVN